MNGALPHKQNLAERPSPGQPRGYYAYYSPGPYRARAVQFIRQCIGEARYAQIADSERFVKYPYVAAKVLLSREDWNRYVWIEHHGTLEGFEG